MKYFVVSLAIVAAALLGVQSAHAATPAQERCSYLYDQQATAQACAEGYAKATSDTVNGLCQQWKEPPAPIDGVVVTIQQLTDACRAGMIDYEGAVRGCIGADASRRAACEDRFRPSSANSAAVAPAASPPTADVSQMPAGPIPANANMKDLASSEKHESQRCLFDGFFGTIVCGVMSVIGKVLDVAFNLLTGMLKTPPLTVTGDDGSYKAVYDVWSQFRNLANFAFAFAFIAIIYSHLSSVGVSNYSIKRMLPRLIIGALLVNLSFYLCGILVDLSNILAATISSIVGAFEPPKINGDIDNWQKIIGGILFGSGAVAVAVAAGVYLNSAVLIPIAVSAVIVIGTTLITLLLRQALIPLFIILSPLAFAAIILPNTKGLFDKWRKIFVPLLMLYPIVALVFGGAKVASQLIQTVAISGNNLMLAVFGLGIQIVPLFAIPWMMKLGGGALNQLGGITDTPVGKLKERAKNYADHRRNITDGKAFRRSLDGHKKWDPRRFRDRAITRKAERDRRRENIDEAREYAGKAAFGGQVNVSQDMPNDISRLEQLKERASRGRYTARGQKDKAEAARDAILKQMSQSSESEAQQRAKHSVIKMKVDAHAASLKAARVSVDHTDLSRNQRLEIANTGGCDVQDAAGNVSRYTASELEREAIIQKFTDGDIGAMIEMSKNTASMTPQQRTTYTQGMRANKKLGEKAPMFANNTVLNMLEHGGSNGVPQITAANYAEHVVGTSIANDNYGVDQMANLDPDVAREVSAAVTGARDGSGTINRKVGTATPEQVRDVQVAAYQALNDDNPAPRQRIVHNRSALEEIAQ